MKQLSIWVVEDDYIYQNILITYLNILGYEVRGFSSGEECLQHLNKKTDVVLLDHNLGEGMNGVDVLRKIKQKQFSTNVIYISGEEQISLVSDTYQNGSEEYITKDSASLLRLKLRLDKIVTEKQMCQTRVRNKIILLGGAVGFVVLFFLCYLFLK